MSGARSGRRGSSARHRSAWAATYEGTPYEQLPWFDRDPSPQVVRAVEENFLPAGAPILDVGCGAGSNVLYLRRSGFEGFGVDISPGAIRAAKARAVEEGLTADFRVGDVLKLEFPRGRFGGVLDNGCFHTLPISRRPDYAAEISRVLRPGGSFVLSWVAREHTRESGPRHRPSLEEVTRALESRFLFTHAEFHPGGPPGAPAVYDAWLVRRTAPQPPAR